METQPSDMMDEDTVGQLRSSKGVEFVSEPSEQPYGVEAIMRDPFGNWFSMAQPRWFEG